MKIISNNHLEVFNELLQNTNKSLFILVPFIKNDMAEHIANIVPENVEIKLVTKIDFDSIANGASDAESINTLRENFSNISVRLSDELHAKVYIFDGHQALITSANLTHSAFMKNFEYGVLIKNEESIDSVLNDFNNIFNSSEPLEKFLERDIISSNKKIKMDKSEVINSISSLNDFTYEPLERDPQKLEKVVSISQGITYDQAAITEQGPFAANKSEKCYGVLSHTIPAYYHIPSSIIQLEDEIRFKDNNKLGLDGKYKLVAVKYFSINNEKNRINYSIRRFSPRKLPLTVGGYSDFPAAYNQYYMAEGTLMKGDVLNNDFFWKKTGRWHSQEIQFSGYKDLLSDGSITACFLAPDLKHNFVGYTISDGNLPPKQFRIMNIDDHNETHVLNDNQVIKEHSDIRR